MSATLYVFLCFAQLKTNSLSDIFRPENGFIKYFFNAKILSPRTTKGNLKPPLMLLDSGMLNGFSAKPFPSKELLKIFASFPISANVSIFCVTHCQKRNALTTLVLEVFSPTIIGTINSHMFTI